MSSDDNVLSFAEKLAARKAAQANALGVTPPAVPTNPQAPTSTAPPSGHQFPDEDVPQLELNIDPEQQALDDAIKNLSILDAYDKWCGKMKPNVGGKREGIMVSCPDPAHPDMNPSAWVNLDKNTYYCPGCAYGGDVWDIAALAYGYKVPGYKRDPKEFRKLRVVMGQDLGFTIIQGYGGTHVVPPGSGQEDPAEAPGSEVPTSGVLAAEGEVPEAAEDVSVPVGKLPSAIEVEQQEQAYREDRTGPTIDWRDILPEDTFLRAWMDATIVDNSPEEFHVWTGLMALGFAVGRKKTLNDLRPVVGNLFVCLVGPSGAGKSQSKSHMNGLLKRVMQWNNSTFEGVKRLNGMASGEALVDGFVANEDDPSSPGNPIPHSVRGLIDYEELSQVVGIAGRIGSTLKPQLMDIYDAAPEISISSRTHGRASAWEPFGQCITTTQNASLSRLLDRGDDDSGFMNRWVFVAGSLKPPIALGGNEVDFERPAELLNQVYMWSHIGQTKVTWSPEAEKLWTEFFHSTLHPTKEQAEKNGSALLNRLDLLMKKLILLFSANVHANVVPKAAVEQAIKMFPYLLATYGVVSAQMAKTEDSELVNKILSAIEKLAVANGQGPTRREIYNTVKKSIKTTKQLGDLLKSMVELEIIKEIAPVRKPGQRGVLGVRYAIAS